MMFIIINVMFLIGLISVFRWCDESHSVVPLLKICNLTPAPSNLNFCLKKLVFSAFSLSKILHDQLPKRSKKVT